jgi:hypothetical protein
MTNKITKLLLILFACFFAKVAQAEISITVSPTVDRVLPGSIRTIYSNTLGAIQPAASWSSNGGTIINSTGYSAIWKAPEIPGDYTVKATSLEDSNKEAIAFFTVIPSNKIRLSNIPMNVTAYKNQPISIQSILWGSTNTAVTWTTTGGMLSGVGREVIFSASSGGVYYVTATSMADNSETSTTTIFVTNNEYPARSSQNLTQPVDCTHTGSGNAYDVTNEAELDAVPWSTLGPGDTVRIQPGTYQKQILISTSGTESQPIRICGVADTDGNLPEINGTNATAHIESDYNPSYSLQGYAGILIFNHNANYYEGDSYPKNIIIEGLKITAFNNKNTYTDIYSGNSYNYINGVAPIRVQHGRNISIRGNELSDCGNGIFSMSNNGVESNTTRNLLIEGNYFHTNGVAYSYREHQSYLQAFGLVVQGNYFNLPRVGMLGGQLKTRSVQQFVRYNYFEPASRIFDLVEIQDHAPFVFPWIGLDVNELINTNANDVVANHEAYQDQYVYGNIIKNVGQQTAAWAIHAAADNDQTFNYGGICYIYHNTFWTSLITGESSSWRSGLVDLGPYGGEIGEHNVWPSVRMTNNAIYIAQSVPTSGRLFFFNRYKSDRVILDKNWISSGWGTGDINGGDGTGISNTLYTGHWQGGTLTTQVSGLLNLISGSSIPFDTYTFIPLSNGPLISSGTALPSAIKDLPPLMHYNVHKHIMNKRTTYQDIGAVHSFMPTPLIKNITTQ